MARKIVGRILAVFVGVCVFLLALASGLLLADSVAAAHARVLPAYEKADLTPIMEKKVWSEEDYAFIYRQTGLTKVGADSVERSRLPEFQDALFYDGRVVRKSISPVTYYDKLEGASEGYFYRAPHVPLEAGDVFVTSSCCSMGWRNGHAALVMEDLSLLQSYTLGADSGTQGPEFFEEAANFMVLRLKDASREARAEIARNAEELLVGVPYSLFVGFFMQKDQCANGQKATYTHCSHLVWQAYKNAGLDIDANGGPLVSPQNIANSPLFEVVQVYGFDLDTLWH